MSIEDESRNFKSAGSEFSIENLNFANSKTFIEALEVDAPTFNFSIHDLNFDSESSQVDLNINGTLKTQLDKRIIKSIDFYGSLTGKKLEIENVNLAFFENHVRLYMGADKRFILSMAAFNPGDYLKNATPLREISSFASLANPMQLLSPLAMSGTLQLHHNNFRVISVTKLEAAELVAFSNRGDENFEVHINNFTILSILGLSTPPKLILSASRAVTPQDHITHFYFGKNLNNLTPQEQAQLSREQSIFEIASNNAPLESRIPASK